MDVHHECGKFATGGQGSDSGLVVIWNLKPVLSEKAELDASVPKVLCRMDNHLACVNCVRWSQSGLMLASGSDDKLVMIWRQSKVRRRNPGEEFWRQLNLYCFVVCRVAVSSSTVAAFAKIPSPGNVPTHCEDIQAMS